MQRTKESGATTVPVPEGVTRRRAAVDRSPSGLPRRRLRSGLSRVSLKYRAAATELAVETGSEPGDLRRPIAPRRKPYRRETRARRASCRHLRNRRCSRRRGAQRRGRRRDRALASSEAMLRRGGGAGPANLPPRAGRLHGDRRWRPASRRRRPPRRQRDGRPPGRNRTRGQTRRGLPRAKFRLRNPRLQPL